MPGARRRLADPGPRPHRRHGSDVDHGHSLRPPPLVDPQRPLALDRRWRVVLRMTGSHAVPGPARSTCFSGRQAWRARQGSSGENRALSQVPSARTRRQGGGQVGAKRARHRHSRPRQLGSRCRLATRTAEEVPARVAPERGLTTPASVLPTAAPVRRQAQGRASCQSIQGPQGCQNTSCPCIASSRSAASATCPAVAWNSSGSNVANKWSTETTTSAAGFF